MSEEDPTLSVGVTVGGTNASPEWERAVKRLGLRLIETRQAAPRAAVALNVVYQIPGEVLTPDFEGVRTGRFFKSKSRLIVQVALPAEVPGDPEHEVRKYLDRAIELAEQFLLKKGFSKESLEPYSQIAERV